MTKYLPAAALLAASTYLALSHLTTPREPEVHLRTPAYTDDEMRAIYEEQRTLEARAEGGQCFQVDLYRALSSLKENRTSVPDTVAAIERSARQHNPSFLDRLRSFYGPRLDLRQSITLTVLLHLQASRHQQEPGASEAYQRVLGELDRWPADRADFVHRRLDRES